MTTPTGQEQRPDVRPLPVGETVRRQLKGGQLHAYVVELRHGQVIQAEVRESGVNVSMFLVWVKDDTPLVYSDYGSGYDRETLTHVAQHEGEYLVLIGVSGLPDNGWYELTARVKDEIGDLVKGRIVAERFLAEGLMLARGGGNDDSLHKAIEKWEEILPVLAYLKETYWEAWGCNKTGEAYGHLGEHGRAIYYNEHALELFRAIGDKSGEAKALTSIGDSLLYVREMSTAFHYFNEALQLVRELGNKHSEGTLLHNIGTFYDYTGKNREALDYYTQALSLREEVGDKWGEAATLNNTALAYAKLNERQKALESYQQGLTLNRQLGDRRGEARTLMNISALYVVSEHPDERTALYYLHRGLLAFQIIDDRDAESIALNSLMLIYHSLKNPRLAIFYGKQSVDRFQHIRSSIQTLDVGTQKRYRRSESSAYRFLTKLMIKEGRLAEAQQVINSLRDEQFFDFSETRQRQQVAPLTLTGREVETGSFIRRLGEQIKTIAHQLDSLNQEIVRGRRSATDFAQSQELEANLQTLSDQFLAALLQAESDFAGPANEKDKSQAVPDAAEMQAALRLLNSETGQTAATLYTFIGDDEFYIVLMTEDESKVFEVPVKADDLNGKLLEFYALLQSPSYDPRPLGKELYDIIFKPVEAELHKAGARTLMWSLDGSLRYVPVAALWDGERYLIESYQHATFTRADCERLTRNVSPEWTGAGFGTSRAHTVNLPGDGNEIGLPALPGVVQELRSIFRADDTQDEGILRGEVFLNAEFTKSAFFEAMEQRRTLVHISSHFEFCAGDTSRSFLLLGDGTTLTLSEMGKQGNLFEGVELLTLSACNTAAAQADASGREIDGFAELAQRLGAAAVMASLWSVADKSTSQLMSEFYRQRTEKPRMTKVAALQSAQRSMIEGKIRPSVVDGWRRDAGEILSRQTDALAYPYDLNKPYAHPYYWSPFILIGNWK